MLKRLELHNFVVHKHLSIDFPERLWIRGPNGAGKSLILDAITYALWGQWRLGSRKTGGSIHLATDKLSTVVNSTREVINGPKGREALPYIRRVIGMDFDLARVTSISLQGEADVLMRATPLQRLRKVAFLSVQGVDRVERKVKSRVSYLRGFLDASQPSEVDESKIARLECIIRKYSRNPVEYDRDALRVGPDFEATLRSARSAARQHFAWLTQKFVEVGETCPVCGNTIEKLVQNQRTEYDAHLLAALGKHLHRRDRWKDYYEEQIRLRRLDDLARHRIQRIGALRQVLSTWRSLRNTKERAQSAQREIQLLRDVLPVIDERRLFAVLSEPLNEYFASRLKDAPIPLSIHIHSDGLEIEYDKKPAEVCSGGERFLASVATRLLLCELLDTLGYGIGAVIIDEGFGSLNKENLELAVQMLETTPLQVVVISHVELPVSWDAVEIRR